MASSAAPASLAAARRLRRIADALDAGVAPDADDGSWLASALRRYLADAPSGLQVAEALQLTTPPGREHWWQIEHRVQRDRLIRELAAEACGSAHARAVHVQQQLTRYAAVTWLRDRVFRTPLERNRVLFQIFTIDSNPPTGIRRLTEIISC